MIHEFFRVFFTGIAVIVLYEFIHWFLFGRNKKMSSDFLEDVDCNDHSVLLTMRASGFAELVVMGPEVAECVGCGRDGDVARFPLIPNKLGLANAEKIASALMAWSEHVQKVGLLQD